MDAPAQRTPARGDCQSNQLDMSLAEGAAFAPDAGGPASGHSADLPGGKLDVDGQHHLDGLGADGFVEQVVDRRLPLQLPVICHSPNLCARPVPGVVTHRGQRSSIWERTYQPSRARTSSNVVIGPPVAFTSRACSCQT